MNEKQLERWEKLRENGKLNFILMQTIKYVLFMTIGSTGFYFLIQGSAGLKMVVSIFFLMYLFFGIVMFTLSWHKNEKIYINHKK